MRRLLLILLLICATALPASAASKLIVLGMGGSVGIDQSAVAITGGTIDGVAITNSTATTLGNTGIGTATFGTSATLTLGFLNGTAPTTAPANTTQLWSADVAGVPGDAGLHILGETLGHYYTFGDEMRLYDTDDGATGPTQEFFNVSASPADDDGTGNIGFWGTDDGSGSIQAASIETHITDVTNGAESGAIVLRAAVNGSMKGFLVIGGEDTANGDPAEVAINDSSHDIDFRVESNTIEAALKVDGASGTVSAPGIVLLSSAMANGETLQIGGSPNIAIEQVDDVLVTLGTSSGNDFLIESSASIMIAEGDTGNIGIGVRPSYQLDVYAVGTNSVAKFESNTAGAEIIIEDPNSTANANRIAVRTNAMEFVTANATRASIDASGIVFMPYVAVHDLAGDNNETAMYIDPDDGEMGYSSSSRRFKDNIVDMGDTSWIYNLRPRNYNRLGSERLEWGLIAEEVAEVAPEDMHFKVEGQVTGTQYQNMIAPMIAEIQGLRGMVDGLKALVCEGNPSREVCN